MANRKDPHLVQDGRRRAQAQPRAVGSPLARGPVRRQPFAEITEGYEAPPTAYADRSLSSGAEEEVPTDGSSTVQRALQAMRAAIPFVQRILPLLDGNIGSAIASVLNQKPPQVQQQQQIQPLPPQRPTAQVSLVPLQEGINDLQIHQRELHEQVVEQSASLRKVEDQLEMVREATDRNTLEQQELMEDLKYVGKKVNIVTLIVVALLLVSLILNLVLYLHIQRVLP